MVCMQLLATASRELELPATGKLPDRFQPPHNQSTEYTTQSKSFKLVLGSAIEDYQSLIGAE